MDKRTELRIQASMEGLSAVMKGTGKKHKVSDMQLMVLCNMAEMGMLLLFSGVEGPQGHDAADKARQLSQAINKHLGSGKEVDEGLCSLMRSTAAILRTPFFQKYIFSIHDEVAP